MPLPNKINCTKRSLPTKIYSKNIPIISKPEKIWNGSKKCLQNKSNNKKTAKIVKRTPISSKSKKTRLHKTRVQTNSPKKILPLQKKSLTSPKNKKTLIQEKSLQTPLKRKSRHPMQHKCSNR